MRPEREYRRMAIVALDFIQKYATAGKEAWKGQTPPTMEEVDSVIRDLSYFVGALKVIGYAASKLLGKDL